ASDKEGLAVVSDPRIPSGKARADLVKETLEHGQLAARGDEIHSGERPGDRRLQVLVPHVEIGRAESPVTAFNGECLDTGLVRLCHVPVLLRPSMFAGV